MKIAYSLSDTCATCWSYFCALKIYSKYTCYIKWEDNTSNDRLKSIKDIIVIPEETYINMGIDNILISSLLLEGVV